ncbi:MFS general substrate transporter [Hymenopellis radicata]|nr:MFS general substrate transporter [Hymenopellis radicata]
MSSENESLLTKAKNNVADLFRWKTRVHVIDIHGNETVEWQSPKPLQNPISLFGKLTALNWLFFLVGFAAWTADALDFHTLSIKTTEFSKYYDVSKTSVTTAITLTLLLRSVGAAIFGVAGDYWGRKYPMVLNMWILGALQIATIYCRTFQEFLAVRAIFGLAMGGVYGNAVAMALENCPVEARGLMSGILQQGYSFGYVIGACVNLKVGDAPDSWKPAFWGAAGASIAVGFIRLLFPESRQFVEAKKSGKRGAHSAAFKKEIGKVFRKEWKMMFYCVILMTWFNYYSHSSQDSYTTFMKAQKGLDNDGASRASILMKTGACVGGTIIGWLSQFVGRRRAIVAAAIISCCMIPAWILPTTERSLSASGFFMQFFVQGAWGVIPIHLSELSPVAFRSSFPGITYQVGNMISSPSAQIVNAIAESHFIRRKSDGELVEAYGPTMGIATVIIALGIALTTALGPEKCGSHFEAAPVPSGDALPEHTDDVDDDDSEKEKGDIVHDENAKR